MKKHVPLTKENLEKFCIETNAIAWTPSIAAALSEQFGLDYQRIRLGWMKRNAEDDKKRMGKR